VYDSLLHKQQQGTAVETECNQVLEQQKLSETTKLFDICVTNCGIDKKFPIGLYPYSDLRQLQSRGFPVTPRAVKLRGKAHLRNRHEGPEGE
jgi:hypothetical protein